MGPLAVLLLSSWRSMVPSFVALLLQILVGDAAEKESKIEHSMRKAVRITQPVGSLDLLVYLES